MSRNLDVLIVVKNTDKKHVVSAWCVVELRSKSEDITLLDNKVGLLRDGLICHNKVADRTAQGVVVLESILILVELNLPFPATDSDAVSQVQSV